MVEPLYPESSAVWFVQLRGTANYDVVLGRVFVPDDRAFVRGALHALVNVATQFAKLLVFATEGRS